ISGSGPQPRGWGCSRASARAETRAAAIGGLLWGGSIGSQRHSSRQASTMPSTSSRSSVAMASGRRSALPIGSHYAFQTEGDNGAGLDGPAGMGQEAAVDGRVVDDRIAPVVERDALGEQLGAEAVAVAPD